MLILPSILFTLIGTWMAARGSRTAALACWVLAMITMFGAMYAHMSDQLNINL